MPGDPERDVGRPLAERAAERVAHDHGDVAAETRDEAVAEPRRRGIRVEREQHERPRSLRVRGVDAGGRADEAVPRLGDHERRPRADDADALAQDPARRGAGRGRRRARARAADGSTSSSPTTRPSAFETTFCATTTTSAVLEAPRPHGGVERGAPRGRRRPRPPGCPRAGRPGASAGHGRPVTRTPACAL